MMTDENEMMGAMGMAEPMGDCSRTVVPAAALAMPDEREQLVNPEPGDRVTYTVEGTVESVQGDKVAVKVASINGSPVESEEKEEPAEPGEGAGYAALEDEAKGISL